MVRLNGFLVGFVRGPKHVTNTYFIKIFYIAICTHTLHGQTSDGPMDRQANNPGVNSENDSQTVDITKGGSISSFPAGYIHPTKPDIPKVSNINGLAEALFKLYCMILSP